MSVELYGWSVSFWNLWWSPSISNNLPTTSLFSLLHAFVSCSLFLVYLFSLTVKFLITSIRLSMVTCLFLSSSFNKEISRSVPISWWQSLPVSVTLFAIVTNKSSVVPESTYSADDASYVCVSMLTHSLGGSRVIYWRFWLIILSRGSISSLMIDKHLKFNSWKS